jgi:hypothetical protein
MAYATKENNMDLCEWKQKYIDRLIERGLDPSLAQEVYAANKEENDMDDDPRESADDELSYWGGN